MIIEKKLPFRKVELADKDTVRNFTKDCCYRNCDLNFMNICSWQFLYDTQIAIVDGWLLFRFKANNHLAYMMPLGSGDLKEIVNRLAEDSAEHGHPLLILGACDSFVDKLEQTMPGRFRFSHKRDYSDYIYSRSSLSALEGKKLQPKRNHINQFMRNFPSYEYRPLTSDLIPLCIELENKWINDKIDFREDKDYMNESRSMNYAFEHWEKLDGIGGTIFVDDRLIAFTFGAAINSCTFDVCVEKADSSITGAYSIINRDFVSHLPENFVWINREEDLGIEGLRKAKLSYNPTLLLNKYSAIEKHQD